MDFLLEGFIEAFALLIRGDPEAFSAILITLRATTLSMAISLLAGLPAGFALGYGRFRGQKFLRLMADTLMALPTVFIGLMVYAFLSRRGPLGGLDMLFTVPGIAAGQAILALPVVTALTASAVEGMDHRLRLTLLSLGAGRRQLLLTTLWEARHGIVAAGVAAYGRVLTEVGISMMVGGNIKWHTRTITTAIALETNKGKFATGIALGLALLAIALAVNATVSFLRAR